MSDQYEPDERHEELLRRALRREADTVLPAGDGLTKIRARVRRPPAAPGWARAGWARVALVAGAAAIAAVAAVGVLNNDHTTFIQPAGWPWGGPPPTSASPAPPPSQSATPVPPPAPAPSASSQAPAPTQAPDVPPAESTVRQVSVYYLGETEQGQRLYREKRVVDVEDGATVKAALTAMFTLPPLDPDYRSLWPGETTVLGISRRDDTVTVDLSSAALNGSAAQSTELSLQQLVYTVTANDPDAHWVRLRVDGEPVSRLWGRPVANPLKPAPKAYVQGPVWITRPDNGAEAGSPVEFGGYASVFEATVSWEVRRGGELVDEGTATATAGAPAFGTWRASVTLPPGTYELRAFEASAEDGTPMFADTKTITVR
jgi:hypothetical protein